MTWQEKAIELWGERWISVLSKMSRMNRRDVQRWAKGQYDPPQWFVDKVNATHEMWVNEQWH
jgi:hypothetical protein